MTNPDRHTNTEARREYMREYMRKRRESHGRRLGLNETQLAEIKQLYLGGMGTDPIGERFGCNGSTICYWLEKMGVKRRRQWSRHDIMPNARTMRMTGIKTQAIIAAATFNQPTLVSFLPDNPQLEADWQACLAIVKAERSAMAAVA